MHTRIVSTQARRTVSAVLLILLTGLASVVHAAPEAAAFGELPVAFDGAISPDGNRIAIIVNVNGTYNVTALTFKSDGEKPWQLSLGESIKPGYVKWVNNERFVVSVKKSQRLDGTPFTVSFLFTGDV